MFDDWTPADGHMMFQKVKASWPKILETIGTEGETLLPSPMDGTFDFAAAQFVVHATRFKTLSALAWSRLASMLERDATWHSGMAFACEGLLHTWFGEDARREIALRHRYTYNGRNELDIRLQELLASK